MGSIEDDLVLPIPDEPSSPIKKPKLRRLKKSSSSAATDSIRVSDDPIVRSQDSAASAVYGPEESSNGKDLKDDLDPLSSGPLDDPIIPSSGSPIPETKEFDDDLDPLFSVPAFDEGFETLHLEREMGKEEDDASLKIGKIWGEIEKKSARKRLNLFEESEEVPTKKRTKKSNKATDKLGEQPKESGRGKKRSEKEGVAQLEQLNKKGEIEGEMEKEKSARKRLNLDEESEEVLMKKKKKKSDKVTDKLGAQSKAHVREKKRSEKERMAQLEQIHAESQRLLRETRDASFKPVPVVHKPISSVLEKIRLRKLEVLKQTGIFCLSDSIPASDCSMEEAIQKSSDQVMHKCDSRENAGSTEVDDFAHLQAVGSCSNAQDACGETPCNSAPNLESKDTSPTMISETQEATGDKNQSDDLEKSLSPPLPTSESVPDDLSSEEEDDDDKENIDPHTASAVNVDSSPEHGLARAFLDDEAEEEDDSDHDLMRFQDNEEDNESDEEEVLKDLIETSYKEAPVDHEKRNRLHQKWLEQQDAAGTEDILQRLKYGQKQKEPSCLHDDDDDNEDNGDSDEESADEKSNGLPVTDNARQNSKKAKQMIAEMFTDANDSYLPSDEEESEQILLRQRLLKQNDESSFISPIEDEHSREVFGLIKKLNTAPAVKKKGRTASSFESLVMGANSNSSSKLSFLNRTASSSMPSLHKQTSTTVRAFIFGRDDSNSRSAISASESNPKMDPKENHSSKSGASKVNRAHLKSTAMTKAESSSGPTSGSSLFQILRHSSVQFDRQFHENRSNNKKITETQAAYQFSAFKVGKRATKAESRI